MLSFTPITIVIMPIIAVGIAKKKIDKEVIEPSTIVHIDTNFDHLYKLSTESLSCALNLKLYSLFLSSGIYLLFQ